MCADQLPPAVRAAAVRAALLRAATSPVQGFFNQFPVTPVHHDKPDLLAKAAFAGRLVA
jgi:hypothetical protein